VKSKNVVRKAPTDEDNLPENAATNVIDFADLLKRSLEKKGDKGGAKPAPAKKAAKKAPAKKATAAKKRTGRKSA
jgi:DNA end-binding protein Ku